MKGTVELIPRYDAARGRVWDLVAISGAGRPDKFQRAVGATRVPRTMAAGTIPDSQLESFLESQRRRGRRVTKHEMPGGFCVFSVFGERHTGTQSEAVK